MVEFTVVENLHRKDYPDGLSKGDKVNLRCKCHKNFGSRVDCYTTGELKVQVRQQEAWRVCIRTTEEKEIIVDSCHAGVEGINYYTL